MTKPRKVGVRLPPGLSLILIDDALPYGALSAGDAYYGLPEVLASDPEEFERRVHGIATALAVGLIGQKARADDPD